MLTASHILDMARVVAKEQRLALATISTRMFHDGKRLAAIENGRADLKLSTAADALRWLSDNWPADAEWPVSISRPTTSPKSPEAA